MRHEEVSLATITVDPKHRTPKPAAVKRMADSIIEVGLLSPIGLNDSHCLIYGRTRLLAMRELGNTTIPAMILDCSDIEAGIAEIDENVVRTNLTALEEGRALKRRKQLYLAKHPETARGAKNQHTKDKLLNDNLSFSEDAASKTGKSKRTIERQIALAESIPDEIAEQIADTPLADNQSELKKLAKLPPEKQAEVAAEVKQTGRGTVAKKRKKAKPREIPVVDDEPSDKADKAADEWAAKWMKQHKLSAPLAACKIESLAVRVRNKA